MNIEKKAGKVPVFLNYKFTPSLKPDLNLPGIEKI